MTTRTEGVSSVIFFILLALLLQVLFFSPLSSPDCIQLPKPGNAWNNQLQKVTKLGEGILDKSEDVVFDEEGALYTGTRDGWIKKMHRNGSWENWKYLATESMLGITTSSTPGHFIVCNAANVRHFFTSLFEYPHLSQTKGRGKQAVRYKRGYGPTKVSITIEEAQSFMVGESEEAPGRGCRPCKDNGREFVGHDWRICKYNLNSKVHMAEKMQESRNRKKLRNHKKMRNLSKCVLRVPIWTGNGR